MSGAGCGNYRIFYLELIKTGDNSSSTLCTTADLRGKRIFPTCDLLSAVREKMRMGQGKTR